MKILYHDAHILLVDKPSGLLSQPGKTIDDCVHRRLQVQLPNVELLHRLDQHTSGIMVFALSKVARKSLATQFQNRQIGKRYQALIYGKLPQIGSITLSLRCDWPNRPKQEVHREGKAATTYWQVLQELSGYSRIALTPITGRSHQLRVHMASLNCPILGDSLYACPKALTMSHRLCLHAEVLRFNHPITNKRMEFICSPNF